MTGDCCVFKFLRRSVDRKHLMRFQSENTVFKFLRRSLGAALEDNIYTFYSCYFIQSFQNINFFICRVYMYMFCARKRLHLLCSALLKKDTTLMR